jgi:cytochrome c oxidase assembly factor CtaG
VPADTSWTFEPGAILLIAVLAALYVPRWRRARDQAGPRGASGWRLAAWLGGLALLVVALLSPVDRLASRRSRCTWSSTSSCSTSRRSC